MFRRMILTVIVIGGAVMFSAAGSAFGFTGGSSGYSGNPATNGGSTCASCHSGGPVPSVAISGPAAVTVGSTSTYTLTMTGSQAAGGLDVSSTAGTLVSTGADTKILAGEIVHNGAKQAAGGIVSWTFDWTAPATAGSATLYAAGNSVDLAAGAGGDGVAQATLAVTISAAANQAPSAVVSAALQGVPLEGMTFDGTGSSDPDGTIVAYRWDFGDGTPVVDFGTFSSSLQHSFVNPGTYTVTLTVEDNAGSTGSASVTVTVATGTPPPPPTVPPTTTTTTTTIPATTTTSPATTTTTPGSVSASAVYGANCASCHGASGEGGLGPSLITSTSSTGQIAAVINNGSGSMPGYSTILSSAELDAVTRLSKNFQSSDPVATTTTTIPATATGADIYATSCATCHGAAGEGGIAGSLIDGPVSSALVGSIVANGIGTMPGFSDTLTSDQIQLVASHVASIAPTIDITTDGSTDDDPNAEPADPGTALYNLNCASCHGVAGVGDSASALNIFFDDDDLVGAILRGPSDMPGFADILGDDEVRLIADYVHGLEVTTTTQVAGASQKAGSGTLPQGPSDASLGLAKRLAGIPSSAPGSGPDFPLGVLLGMVAATGGMLVGWFTFGRQAVRWRQAIETGESS